MYSEKEKVRAIHAVIYGAVPETKLDGELLMKISKWLFERKYGHLLNL